MKSSIEFNQEIGRKIRLYRKLQHITQKELALQLNKTVASISKYEQGAINIDTFTLYQIADYLQISPAMLLPESEVPVPDHDRHVHPFFNRSRIYFYTWSLTSCRLLSCVLEVNPNSGKVSAYLDYEDLNHYQDSHYVLHGSLICNDVYVALRCYNPLVRSDYMVALWRTSDLTRSGALGSTYGLTHNYHFLSAKCFASHTLVSDKKALIEALEINKQDLGILKKNNILVL